MGKKMEGTTLGWRFRTWERNIESTIWLGIIYLDDHGTKAHITVQRAIVHVFFFWGWGVGRVLQFQASGVRAPEQATSVEA